MQLNATIELLARVERHPVHMPRAYDRWAIFNVLDVAYPQRASSVVADGVNAVETASVLHDRDFSPINASMYPPVVAHVTGISGKVFSLLWR
jgi:hypothetical protein